MKHRFAEFALLTSKERQQQVDSLAGAARGWNDINRAQRLTQAGQKSAVECKGKSQPDCVFNNKRRKEEILA